MTVGVPHSGGADGEESRAVTIGKAILTLLLVTVVVAAALGGATYLASRLLVGMLS